MEIMNVALLSKWKWRILNDKEAVWRDLLEAREVRVCVGNGESTPFWYAHWIGQHSLMASYPEGITVSSLAENDTAGAGLAEWNSAVRELQQGGSSGGLPAEEVGTSFVAASSAEQQPPSVFGELLRSTAVLKDVPDSFSWTLATDGIFSVKSCYDFLKAKLSGPDLLADKVRALSHLWKVKAPSKVLFFCWRFIHNRLATRDLLVSRGILNEGSESLCVLCMKEEESRTHLFLNCDVSITVWRRVYMWLGVGDFLSLEEFQDFLYNCDKFSCLSKRAILSVAWLATIWTLWLKCNAIIFKKESFSFLECMSEILIISWNWLGSFYKKAPLCNYFGWNTQPLLCFTL
ncbi:uncharacterized protein LOC131604078 [Vicia villosa]|uniref:uncharacterized protein LOC131604078 n=1 Tax=Vicia villosa TaxID=3911 RepID=UPI00273BA7D2|nr:uncharacterized protein LOC131604078 [Vicia villosa]